MQKLAVYTGEALDELESLILPPPAKPEAAEKPEAGTKPRKPRKKAAPKT
jgi:hypothetical protein